MEIESQVPLSSQSLLGHVRLECLLFILETEDVVSFFHCGLSLQNAISEWISAELLQEFKVLICKILTIFTDVTDGVQALVEGLL